MAIELLDLPTEILTIIFSYLDMTWSENQPILHMTKPNLCALALTCRRISALSRNLIFRNITVMHTFVPKGGFKPGEPFPNFKDYTKLLLRSWYNDPTLYFDLLHQVNWCGFSLDETVRDELVRHLVTSETLYELNMLSCYSKDLRHLADRLHIPQNMSEFESDQRPRLFPGLRILRIRPNEPFFNYSYLILKLCCLSSLQHLEVARYGISTMITQKDAEQAAALLSHKRDSTQTNSTPSPGLESLRLSKKPFIEVVDLGRIVSVLSKSQSLKRLRIPPPAPGFKYDDGRRDRFPETNQKFSSAAIVQALLPVANTLEVLSITDPDVIFYAAPDNTCLDLSRFTTLRTLKVSSFVLAGGHHLSLRLSRHQSTTPTLPPPPIWEILPPNLEELYVAFDALEGLFYSAEILYPFHEDLSHTTYNRHWKRGPGSVVQVNRALQWVTELAERKMQKTHDGDGQHVQSQILRHLRRIDLVEYHNIEFLKTGNWWKIGLKSWSLRADHPDVFRKFDEVGIRVDVRVNVPSDWL